MINIKMQTTEVQKLSPKITVVGVGGAGGNAVNNMIASGLEGCEFMVCNTDAQALNGSLSQNRIQLGAAVTGGLGAGSRPEIGRAAAEESLQDVLKHLEGANMVFVTAGMGGGTGTGAAPVIARACREKGILTVGVITKPFHFEGSHRMRMAESGIEEIQDVVDTLIVIPNQNLFRIANEKTTFADAFRMADEVLQSGVRGVTDLMVRPGLVNLDFADIRTAMLEMGKAMMGTGEAEGEKRAIKAAESAINNPLLDDVSMKGAHGVIINVTGGNDMTLYEADEACNRIRDEVDPDANIIFGATFDESMQGKMRVSIVATGIEKESEARRRHEKGPSPVVAGVARSSLDKAIPAKAQELLKSQGLPLQPALPRQSIPSYPSSLAQPELPVSSPVRDEGSMEADSAEMFDQSKFAAGNNDQAVPQNTALRGTRYRDAFIPPKPVDVDYVSDLPSFLSGSAPVSGAQNTASASLMQASQPAPTRKRSLSLFERITGSVQQTIETIEGVMHREEPVRKNPPSFQDLAGVPSASPKQGSLNIESPAAKPAQKTIEDELDIPAFLRRQAN
jgi:cell division protein FtsZ